MRRMPVRRLVRWLVIVDVVVVAAALVTWLALRDGAGDERANSVNDGLRGSRPPAGRTLLRLDEIPDLRPDAPSRGDLAGNAVMLVGTCLDCRSGDVIGGLLGRMRANDLPDDARIVLVGWGGDASAWRRTWHVGGEDAVPVTVLATDSQEGAAVARRLFGVGPIRDAEESGITYLYDTRGRQRSTFFLGQLHREDLAHDLAILDRR
ncbi:MAG: hypothetical protein JWM86_2506 [Thermoleophilia bacterium]|nr:hypothetical protein [Thermoleophilia bacterium]